MQRSWREACLYFLLLVLVALAIGGACFAWLRTSYAGVTDDGVVAAGVAAYPDYLRDVVRSIVILGIAQVVVIFVVTAGVVPVVLAWRRTTVVPRASSPWHRVLGIAFWLGVAALAYVLGLGAEARRHPGLFLPILSAFSWAPEWLAVSRWAWPTLVVASLAGWVVALGARRPIGVKVLASMGLMASAGWLATFEVRHPSREKHAMGGGSPRAPSPYPNILLLGVDSLRPDKIDERTTPALARLLRESIYFPHTLVTLPRTAPSWAALLTSLSPLANGVETMFPTAQRSRLAEVAMPAHLASLGYDTAVISEYAGESFGRMKFGFHHQAVPRVELEQILGQGLLGREPAILGFAAALYTGPPFLRGLLPAPLPELMRGLASFAHPAVLADDLARMTSGDGPWFGLVFYSQPHFPYTSSAPFFGHRLAEGADPALRFGKDVARGAVRNETDRAQIDALYRAALAETDAAIGDLLNGLETAGKLDDTLVVLTADHGEGLYECATCVGHGDNLTGMSALTVPLAFRLPRRRFPASSPHVEGAYVSQLDVYPTILELVGVARPVVQEGLPLLSKEGRPAVLPQDRVFFAETGEWLWPTPAVPARRIEYPPITALASIEDGRIVIEEQFLPVIRAAKHRVAIAPPFKLLYEPTPSGVAWHLYHMSRDPEERRDLTATHPEVAARLRAALRHSVLRHAHMLPEGDFFLTRPEPPREEYY